VSATLSYNSREEHSDMEYNTALCDFLRLPADPCTQSYTDVTTQIYPLRANPKKIEDFCNQYLNIGNPHDTFASAGPWIIMQVCEYARMSFAEQGEGRFAHRWFAQHELAFGIPIRCTSNDNGSKDFGVVYPFIFVDNPLSMEGGRQIYGWPKAGIDILSTQPEFDPNGPRSLVRVSLSPFLINKAGQQDTKETFVEICQTRPFLSGRSGIAGAITSIPRVLGGFLSTTSVVLNSIASLGNVVSGYRLPMTGNAFTDIAALGSEIQSLGEAMQKSYGYFNSFVPTLLGLATGSKNPPKPGSRPKLTIYTMKQVRDASDTKNACYQAIVRSQMTIDEVKDGGLLFDPLSGDPTGGIEIKLNSTNKYMNTLIDMVSENPTNGDGSERSVRPLIPFWEKVDLSYGLADRQSWRTKQTDWQQDPKPSPATGPRADSPSVAVRAKVAVGRRNKNPPIYQIRGSGSSLAVSGRRNAHQAVLHIFMLKADHEKLQELIDRYLNDLCKTNRDQNKPSFKFEVKEYPFVYITLLSYEDMTIESARDRSYGDTMLTFAVLVKYWNVDEQGGRQGDPEHAFVPLYTFVGTDWNFVTEYEVYGRLTFKSILRSPEDAWVKQSAPSREENHEVLSVSTTLFPGDLGGKDGSAGEGKGAGPIKVIGIYSIPSPEVRTDALESPLGDRSYLREVLLREGLAEYLTIADEQAQQVPKSISIALKQVRNAIHGQCADYQSLIAVPRSFNLAEKFDISSVKIRIYKREGFPLVEKMGLIGQARESLTTNEGASVSEQSGDDPSSYQEFEAKSLSFTGDLNEYQGTEWWRRVAPAELWTKVN
jgi:hypothetical protein